MSDPAPHAAPEPPIHDRAVILSTGDELMTGQLQDTNARWLSARLLDLGILVVGHAAVGDDLDALVAAIQSAVARAPLVIMSGGLGPTDGDLTRAAVCAATGDAMVLDPALHAALAAMVCRRGREMTRRQARQAHRPSRATPIINAFGTAPGLHARVPSATGPIADLVCLPGPPGELRPMFEASVRGLLRPPSNRIILTRLVHAVGIAEADCVERLGDLTRRDRAPLVGVTASGGVLTIRIRHGITTQDGGAATVDALEVTVRTLLGDHALPPTPDAPEGGAAHLAASVLADLRNAGLTLAVVESCTGGLLGSLLSSVPGSSSVFMGGFITYSSTLKERLGVSRETLAAHGAVSEPAAREMAVAGLIASGAGLCLSITGVAGPGGGSDAKPVGTVHIGLAWRKGGEARISSRRFEFSGDREDIRQRACTGALAMLHFHSRAHPAGTPRLLWETTR